MRLASCSGLFLPTANAISLRLGFAKEETAGQKAFHIQLTYVNDRSQE
jgi:hypothetical protein